MHVASAPPPRPKAPPSRSGRVPSGWRLGRGPLRAIRRRRRHLGRSARTSTRPAALRRTGRSAAARSLARPHRPRGELRPVGTARCPRARRGTLRRLPRRRDGAAGLGLPGLRAVRRRWRRSEAGCAIARRRRDPLFFADPGRADGPGRRRRQLPQHRAEERHDRDRPHLLRSGPAEHRRRDRGALPADAPRPRRPRLPPHGMEVQRPQRRPPAGPPSGSASPSRASSTST